MKSLRSCLVVCFAISIALLGGKSNNIYSSSVTDNATDVYAAVDVGSPRRRYEHSVKVFHFILKHWGESVSGLQECGSIACEWLHAEHIKLLRDNLYFTEPTLQQTEDTAAAAVAVPLPAVPTATVSLYNIHTLWERTRDTKPAFCELRTNLTMFESEESRVRYHQLFDSAARHFDGFSSTSPASHVQRVYVEAFLNTSTLQRARNVSNLIKGASYVASDCHNRDSANADRDSVVQRLRDCGLRVDGLGRCMHSQPGPEGVVLQKTKDSVYNLFLKRKAISRFLFNLAFENSIEPGYVTEKPFDALIAGTVPVYLGDSQHLKSLLPHPKAAIFVSDFNNDIVALTAYLQYLIGNLTAYEEHRAWRSDFQYQRNVRDKPLLQHSWHCRVCQWAVQQAPLPHKRTHICPNSTHPHAPSKAPKDYEGRPLRGRSARQVYFVQHGILHGIPDMDTFAALGFDLAKDIIVLNDQEIDKLYIGEPLPHRDSS